MTTKLGARKWTALILIGLFGQFAWTIENMYFNVFLYNTISTDPGYIAAMVGWSAAAATLTTLLMGALSDRLGKRKAFICAGYLLWGLSTAAFGLITPENAARLFPRANAAAAAATLVVVMDCVMTFFGSTANDAAYNAWLTDSTTEKNRGAAEGINAMMPLVAILVVFGGFMGFDLSKAESWTVIYTVIGAAVFLIGILGFFIVDEGKADPPDELGYLATIAYGLRPAVFKKNRALYAALGCFVIFNIAIQIFMPYLIIYYEKSLGMADYVLIMAPAIILAAAVTAVYGRVLDRKGYERSVFLPLLLLFGGLLLLWLVPTIIPAEGLLMKAPVFIGSLLMMSGYLSGMAVFGAEIRNETPERMAGRFQGLRIVAQVLIPGIIGPGIGAAVLKGAATITNEDGTTSFLPNANIFLAAAAVCAILAALLAWYFRAKKKKAD